MILEDSPIIPLGLCGPLACMVALLRYIGKSFSLAAWIATKLGSILAFEFLFWVSYGVFWHRIRCNSKGELHHGMCSWLTNNNSNSKGNYTNRFWPLDHLFFLIFVWSPCYAADRDRRCPQSTKPRPCGDNQRLWVHKWCIHTRMNR